MDGSPITITGLAIIVLLLIFIVMLACNYLGPHATIWLRSNKEEKIGLSKNKLFHANGYMIHSGSDFLLSTSGSFKRFDTVDPDLKQNGQNTAQRTSPHWNLSQADNKIPPQPLRPAPAPAPIISAGVAGGNAKTVTFCMETTLNEYPNKERVAMERIKSTQLPPAIDAPPPPRLSSASAAITTMSNLSAIPRPVAKRPLVKNESVPCIVDVVQRVEYLASCTENVIAVNSTISQAKQLTRRNSSTNPFLCEPIENLNQPRIVSNTSTIITSTNALPNDIITNGTLPTTTDDVQTNLNSEPTVTTLTPPYANSNNNPFFTEPISTSIPKSAPPKLELTKNSETQFTSHIENVTLNGSIPPKLEHTKNSETQFTSHMENVILNGSIPNGNTNPTISTQNPNNKSNIDVTPKTEKHLFRNRSFSETEASDPHLTNFSSKITAVGLKLSRNTNPFTGLTQRVKGPHMLQKTFSEDFLFRNIPNAGVASGGGVGAGLTNGHHGGGNLTWSFGRSFLRHDSGNNLGRRNSSQASLDSSGGSMDSINLERAISCDSVNSESSVGLSDLEQPFMQVTGYLRVGLQYNTNSNTAHGMELRVNVIEAKDVICPLEVDSFDTFVRIYLVPDQAGAMQTQVICNTLSPLYNETFTFWLKKQQGRHSLWFHLYHNGKAHTLLGEAEMEVCEKPCPITTWLPLSDSRQCNAQWGELMFSLSYLPTAERLTVVVVKARNLKLNLSISKDVPTEIQNIFVKIYLMNHEKKLLKKRTSLKRKDRSPIFNESTIFSLPPQSLTTVQLRLTVFGAVDPSTVVPLGHVIVGSCATGKGLRHWHQMLSSLRKPVAMWHVLRRATNQPIFTGGAEAVVAAMRSHAQNAKRNSIF